MKIAYVTTYNSEEVKHWSGTGYYIAEGLKKQGVELVRINCDTKFSIIQRLRRKFAKVFSNEVLMLEREPSYLKAIAKKANKLLSNNNFDVVFSPGSLPVTYIQSNKPIVFFTDATYDCFLSLYLQGEKLSAYSILAGNKAEAAALQKASLVFYTSRWAMESAINKYGASVNKIVQANIGANLFSGKSEPEVLQLINRRKQSAIKNLLFIGVDWYRKGAQKAIDTVIRLNEIGLNVTLTLVGCTLPKNVTLPPFVLHYPFISKSSTEGQMLLNKLFEDASFFILPTIADCTPVVFAEAAAYGIPVITTNTGGCPSVVVDGKTGFCLNENEFTERAAILISELSENVSSYEMLSINAYQHYCKELNWEVVSKRIINKIESLIKKN